MTYLIRYSQHSCKILSICLIFAIVSCDVRGITRPINLSMDPPDGPKDYQDGWTDGCHAGLSSNNSKVILLLGTYKYRFDVTRQNNANYRIAWKHAYDYCGFFMKSVLLYNRL